MPPYIDKKKITLNKPCGINLRFIKLNKLVIEHLKDQKNKS